MKHAEAETFFVAAEFAGLIAELRTGDQQPSVRRCIVIDASAAAGDGGLAALADAESTDDVVATIDEHDPHVMLDTSGTTGAPKGALQSHRSYYLQGMTSHLRNGFHEDDIALSMFPMFTL